MRVFRFFVMAAIAATAAPLLGSCAQQTALSVSSPLNGPPPGASGAAKTAVAGWQGHAADADDAAQIEALRREPKSRAARMLAAVALERVTRRSIDAGRLVDP